MHQQYSLPTLDLFEGLDPLINAAFGVVDYGQASAALNVSHRRPLDLDGTAFVRAVFDHLAGNWERAMARSPRGSAQNFRWPVPQLVLADHNTSAEITLERRLIRALTAAGRTDWSNQVPLISGVAGPHAYKKRAVDLVHQTPEGGFELVELKVASNTPLFASIEILVYGLLWLLSRRDRHRLRYAGRPVVEATTLRLSVLAPAAFYAPYDLADLVHALDEGVAALGRECGVTMSFGIYAFRSDSTWAHTGPYTDAELIGFLDTRQRV